jgi:predicted RND superfamily exporter protein
VLGRGGVWVVLGGTAALLAVALFVVDLAPRVEHDFFFSTDDPQLQASQAIERLFPSRPQILVDARAPDIHSDDYIRRVGELTDALVALDGVAAVRSLTRGPVQPRSAFDSPLWRRLLVAGDGSSTLLLVGLEGSEGDEPPDPRAVVARVEGVLGRSETPDFDLAASGVPWVVEHIRRRLTRDLRVFTLTGLVVFGVVVLLLYRDLWIAAGTLACCLAACAATLLLLKAVDVPIGVLTANLATLVFVLTLSHCIYLTANHRHQLERGPAEAVAAALALTAWPSFWCMVTTLLGFVSLRFASAKPLQELGTAGAVGTVLAFVLAYLLYPAFLRRRRRVKSHPRGPSHGGEMRTALSSRRLTGWTTAGLAVVIGICALGLPRLDTDPSLPAYFRSGGEIRRGIERIDEAGGSSPLTLLFEDADGARLDQEAALVRLSRTQEALETDPAVGTALSLPVLVEEARRNPMAAFLPLPGLLDLLSTSAFDGVARSFVTEDREQGLALLRMRELGRTATEDRAEVVDRLAGNFRRQGFKVELAGGLYPLQGALSDLVRSSVVTGLGGLGLLFVGIGLAVSRSPRVTAVMLACLAGTPVFLFGVLGLLRMPVDLISSPAANVAIAMGIDSMIHLVTAVRRRAGTARATWADWAAARHEMWKPITGSALLLAAGFGIFGLSSFPPTRRFGLAVLLGLAMAAALTLTVLPWGSARRSAAEPNA